MIVTNLPPVAGMYFSAIRNRDDKVFLGTITRVVMVPFKGRLVVFKVKDSDSHASIYLDECYDYAWSDFELPALPGR